MGMPPLLPRVCGFLIKFVTGDVDCAQQHRAFLFPPAHTGVADDVILQKVNQLFGTESGLVSPDSLSTVV